MNRLLKRVIPALLLVITMMLMVVPALAVDVVVPIFSEAEGSLTIHKYTGDPLAASGEHANGLPIAENALPTGATAISGVEFSVYLVLEFDYADYTEDYKWEEKYEQYRNSTKTYEPETEGWVQKGDTTPTNTNGEVTFNSLPLGIYYVVEEVNPAVTTRAPAFFVTVPITDPIDNNDWVYDVHVYPKNTVEDKPKIEKYVTSAGQLHETEGNGIIDVPDLTEWVIFSEIPYGISEAQSYVITDTMDSRLIYKDNLSVAVKGGATLVLDTDYSVDPIGTDNKLIITLLKDGFEMLGDVIAAMPNGETELPKLEIRFKTQIDYDKVIEGDDEEDIGAIGEDIPNTVALEYINSINVTHNSLPDEDPVVHTGGYLFYKSDGTGPLEDASFMIFANKADAESADTSKAIWAYSDLEQKTYINIFTSGENGEVSIYGLEYGRNGTVVGDGGTIYWLVEVQSPEGYNLLKTPVEITVDANSHKMIDEDTYVLTVTNRQGFELPITGGIGTYIFTAGGILLIAIAVVLMLRGRKKKDNA